MKKLSLTISAMILLAACGGSDPQWSDKARDEFLGACVVSSYMIDYCKCSLEELENRYPDEKDIDELRTEDIIDVADICNDRS